MAFEITITLLSFAIELLLCYEKNIQEGRFRGIETRLSQPRRPLRPFEAAFGSLRMEKLKELEKKMISFTQ